MLPPTHTRHTSSARGSARPSPPPPPSLSAASPRAPPPLTPAPLQGFAAGDGRAVARARDAGDKGSKGAGAGDKASKSEGGQKASQRAVAMGGSLRWLPARAPPAEAAAPRVSCWGGLRLALFPSLVAHVARLVRVLLSPWARRSVALVGPSPPCPL